MAEWSIVVDCKSIVRKYVVSSNLTQGSKIIMNCDKNITIGGCHWSKYRPKQRYVRCKDCGKRMKTTWIDTEQEGFGVETDWHEILRKHKPKE